MLQHVDWKSLAPASLAEIEELLTGPLEIFRYPIEELTAKFGDSYVREADFILGKLEDFASLYGHTMVEILSLYERFIERVVEERRIFLETGAYPRSLPGAEPGADENLPPGVAYLYYLTLSTVLNRSRYEVYRHYRHAVASRLVKGSRILEIGGGNCLDSAFVSTYGKVESYELNRASLRWHGLLGLTGRVDLKIELYEFGEKEKYDFVSLVELLEHIVDPTQYLRGAHQALKDGGHAYLTFAVRMPQIDHLYQFESIDHCRGLVYEHGFSILEEYCAIDTLTPFSEEERWRLGDDPRHAVIYCCLAAREDGRRAGALLEDFGADLDLA